MMSKRKSSNRAPSPELSSCSSSSSISYSSKMKSNEGSSNARHQDQSVQLQAKAMALVGCPRCYMYVMSSEVDPKCPKCKNSVFLDLFRSEEEENLKTQDN